MIWFAYLIAFSVGSNQFALNTNPKAETRILEALGPQGSTQAECVANADKSRKRFAEKAKLDSFMRIKFECIQLPLSSK